MPIEREYWRKAEEGVSLDDYPEVNDDAIEFPGEIYITYAVCRKECGHAEFIVDGSTQICDLCGKAMFRTATRKYRIVASGEPDVPKPLEEYHGVWVEVDNVR